MQTTLRGIFLTSANPEKTASFYRAVAGLALEEIRHGDYAYWKLDASGIQLAIHDAAAFADYSHPANPESNLTHLYFKIADMEPFLAHLAAHGVAPHATDEVTVTVTDPDGRKVLFGTA